jgi:polysaccharide biosynthesis protein PelB
MNSVSNADKYGEPRERFSGPFVSLGIMLAFMLLLYFLFPEKEIMESMAKSAESSAVALNYREAMLRARPADINLRMEFAEGLAESGQFPRALHVLNECEGSVGKESRLRYLGVRYRVLKGILFSAAADAGERNRLAGDFSRVVRELAESGAVSREVGRMAWEAGAMGDNGTAAILLRRYAALNAGRRQGGDPLPPLAEGSPDHYREEARLCFVSMKKAKGLSERRALFMRGVQVLRSGNLAGEALAAGEANIDGVGPDRQVLLFMTRIALAAGKPAIAERYIKKALGMERREVKAAEG